MVWWQWIPAKSNFVFKAFPTFKMSASQIGVGPGFILKAHGNNQSSRNNNSTLSEKYRKSFQPDALQHWGHLASDLPLLPALAVAHKRLVHSGYRNRFKNQWKQYSSLVTVNCTGLFWEALQVVHNQNLSWFLKPSSMAFRQTLAVWCGPWINNFNTRYRKYHLRD